MGEVFDFVNLCTGINFLLFPALLGFPLSYPRSEQLSLGLNGFGPTCPNDEELAYLLEKMGWEQR